MGAAVLEPAQFVAEPLHEHRARRNCRAEPIPVLGDVMRKTEKRPDAREPRLLVSDPRRIDQGVGPTGERARCRDLWLHRSRILFAGTICLRLSATGRGAASR